MIASQAEAGSLRALKLSRLCFGTMRLTGAGDSSEVANLIDYAIDRGIDTFHCSSEYETFPLFQAAWRVASRSSETKVIGKIGVPHFGEDGFSRAAFRSKVEAYLHALGIERLDVVQWLLRYDLKQEEARLRIFHEAAQDVADVVAELKREGKIASCVGFPYTAPIAEALLQADYCDGLAVYMNPLEREMDGFVQAAAIAGKSVIGIRPFAAGRLFDGQQLTANAALQHVFAFPAVVCAMVSASSRAHIDDLLAALPPQRSPESTYVLL